MKWGHNEEFFELLKKYQLAILEREKQLGYVTQYTVYAPGLHTSEDQRWDYRVFIVYKDQAATKHSKEITRQLFPNQRTFKKDENHRWELTEGVQKLIVPRNTGSYNQKRTSGRRTMAV